MTIAEEIKSRRIFFDGGLGTLLQDAGLGPGELPETWNLSHPEIIRSIHKDYLLAGCDIINTNTFGANSLKYPENLEDIVTSAVRLAKEARIETGRIDAKIALDIGPSGKLLEPMGDLSFEAAVSLFSEIVKFGSTAGADLILIETMADSYEVKAAVLAAKEQSNLPVFTTLVFDESGKMLTGGTPESITALLEGLRVDALGINCSLGPKQMFPIVKRFLDVASVPVIANPNAGLPRSEHGRTVYDVGAEEFAALMKEMAQMGVHGIGGCCGTTPEHIRATIEACKNIPFHPPVEKEITIAASFSKAVIIDQKPVIIGERINPTGKKKFKAALVANDIDYILQEGIRQEDDGADILDVNVGLPEIDEPALLQSVVKKLQSITPLPLQIDTSDLSAMEQAMRVCNGKPLINSVNGKKESMEAVFPLIQKYGGVVVALLLDEGGIPETAEQRIAIANKIYDTAKTYGISKKDIVLDALALTVSSDPYSALVTLETLRRIRDELHGHSILGVSNISFGLPQRQLINASFFTMAMHSGLSCAIINPGNLTMMAAYRSYLALAGLDEQCADFISEYGSLPPLKLSSGPSIAESASIMQNASSNSSNASSKSDIIGKESVSSDSDALGQLGMYIVQGLEQPAASLASELLQNGADALKLVNEELIPALNLVGQKFEKGTLFLPQLLMSAEAAKGAFEVVKSALPTDSSEKKDKIILATVKGDIHDIGKNIVKVLLENYGYQVLDLGRDVPPERIVQTALDEDIKVVGLSALMTTTVVSMEETIKELNEQKPDTKIVVGGAVMNPDYAKQIGADCYAKDAMATVRFADQVFESIHS